MFTSDSDWERGDWYHLLEWELGGFLCPGSCGVRGGGVSRSMWKASLFQRSLVWEERRQGTALNTALWLWLGTGQETALWNHSHRFDWCISMGAPPEIRVFVFFHRTRKSNIFCGVCVTTDDASCLKVLSAKITSSAKLKSLCLPFHLDGNVPRTSFNKSAQIDNCYSRQPCELNWMSEFQLKASSPGIAHWEMQTEFLW